VVLDPRQKWDYFELGIEQGDWTEREVEAARGVVQLLWAGEYKEAGLDSASQRNGELVSPSERESAIGILDQAEEHHRQWQAKRRRITPGMSYHLIICVEKLFHLY